MNHFLILHDSNKLEDYSLDPVISPPIDYGSWSAGIIPSVEGGNGRSIASILMEYDMTLYVRLLDSNEIIYNYTKNYLYWNFEKNADPLVSPVSTNDHADRDNAAAASDFGRIYIHSGKTAEGKKEYYFIHRVFK